MNYNMLKFSSFILKFGIPNTFAMVSYTHKFQEESKVRGSLK